jgi:ABC-type multidrug transport system ATPase subunit
MEVAQMPTKSAIEVMGLSKSLGKRKIIDNIDLLVKEGDVFGFLGPNGSGKTTTIRMLLGLIHSDQGTIKLNGYDVKKDFYKAIESVGAVVETPKFYPYLSGRKNLELMGNLIPNLQDKKIDEVLEMVGLANRGDDRFRTYSLGMKQRLGIANALLNNPKLVILDEPTNGLDPSGMKEVRDIILKLAHEQGITFFISTHLLHEVEQICSRVAILQKGKILTQGSVKDLMGTHCEIVEVYTPSPKQAEELLKKMNWVKSVEKSQNGLIVNLEKGHASELNRYLITNGIDVEYLFPRKQSLESIFIELTKGEDQIA